MNTETTQSSISAIRGENPNVVQEGLDAEVRNHNNEVEQPALNSTGEINRLVGGTSPTDSIQQYKDAVKKALERSYLEFLYSQSMGSWKSWAYADYLCKKLGFAEEQAGAIEAEVYKEFGKTADSGDWDIFLNGSPEQRKALQDAIAYEMYGEGPYDEATDETGKNSVAHPNTAPDSSLQESESYEARISRALDKAGVKGAKEQP